MNILTLIGNLLGIGKGFLENKAKLKTLKQEQDFAIIEAQTKANVDRILSNTDSDNQIDLRTAQDKRHSLKDEVVTYLFLIPVIIATVTPFIIAYKDTNSSRKIAELACVIVSFSYFNRTRITLFF